MASTEDQTAIISGWSACLNYFDSSLPFQLSFVNRRSRNANRYKVNIPAQEDDFNSIRGEYVEMLKGQIAKSNNGIERYKYIKCTCFTSHRHAHSKPLFILIGAEFLILYFVWALFHQPRLEFLCHQPHNEDSFGYAIMRLHILLNAVEKRFGHSNGQRPFFLVVLKDRTLERFLAMFPLIQCLIQKALNQCLLGEGRMSIQVGLQPLKHVI